MSFTRAELDVLWTRWLEANREAERLGDWGVLADFYAADATYAWMYIPDEHFMAVGREEIRAYALGTEMAGLEGWHYDYVATVTDERAGMIVGFWRQRSGLVDASTGEEHEILGIGGSWIGVVRGPDGGLELGWQRQPGHFRLADLPSSVWPPPVEAGAHTAQAPAATEGPR